MNVKIALQPPPNVDFVVGYPGIPPGARDRPQAAVKGVCCVLLLLSGQALILAPLLRALRRIQAVEVRVSPQGAKAKWVRVELKKIETLPGGGQANSYYDHVGSSPVPLWQSSEEYSMLQSQDFPFFIRIPESIPPSIALDRGAGIRYELVATACTLGKKGFFRRRKTTVVSHATTIIIDKHELHSTWPVYSQPESRSTAQDGVQLTVERSRTCYGPGDRVSVAAILKAESVQPIVLRGFEFTLRETTVFRAGPHPPGGGGGGGGGGIGGGGGGSNKRTGPQIRVSTIGEQKVPLSATLYSGAQHKAEMGCLIPNTHTTTSLNAARHIDITYVIVVRAWIGAAQNAQSVTLELPVIVSNWPRSVSEEAIRRIGHAPSLCMTSPSSTAATVPITTPSPHHQSTNSFSGTPDYGFSSIGAGAGTGTGTGAAGAGAGAGATGAPGRGNLLPPRQHVQYSSAPIGHNGTARRDAQLEVDEFGGLSDCRQTPGTVDHPGYGGGGGGGPVLQPPAMTPIEEDAGSSTHGGANVTARPSLTGSVANQRRRPSATSQATNAHNRLTITNYSEREAEDVAAENASAGVTAARPSSAGRHAPWLTAEEEKKRLYENAVAKVQKVQGAMGSAVPSSDPAPVNVTPKKPSTPTWPTAEEEKVRLYDHAQAVARRTQAYGTYSPSLRSRSSSDANGPSRAASPPRGGGNAPAVASPSASMSVGAALYQSAVSSMSSKPSNTATYHSSTPSMSSPSATTSSPRHVPHYPSAEEEKAALKRYHEAKLAVDRSQNTQYATREGITTSAPASYDALYPQGGSSSSGAGGASGSTSCAPAGDMPPPFEASGSQQPLEELDEKERLRRQYEAQDAAALAGPPSPTGQGAAAPSSLPAYSASIPAYSGPPPMENGLSEKEIMRRRYEEQDAAALVQQQPSLQAPLPQPYKSSPPRINGTRAQPVPPVFNGQRPLTAAEEKAQLKAKYEAEEREARGLPSGSSSRANSYGLNDDDIYTPPSRHPYALANGTSSSSAVAPPPPLLPRPPAEYIQETQEEDMRRRYYTERDGVDNIGMAEALQGLPPIRTASPLRNPHLEIRPFSPFDAGLGYDTGRHSLRSPPPRPPQM
ncbi:hypothetical protein ID866_7363 [Astraeus odoratus]|nr:hypothetical protein ID866_7363 [Astraeus odoratus]